MTLKAVILVLLVILQMHSVISTRSTLTECSDCDILKRLQKRSPADSLYDDLSSPLLETREDRMSVETKNFSEENSDSEADRSYLRIGTDSTEWPTTEIFSATTDGNDATFFIAEASPTEQTTGTSITIQSNTVTTTISSPATTNTHTAIVNITNDLHNLSTITLTEISSSFLPITTNTYIPDTSTDLSSTTKSPVEPKTRLGLILGLTLGLGLPITVVLVGGLICYFKVYRPRQSRVFVLTN